MRHQPLSLRTRLPMSAFASPASSPQSLAQRKENQQDVHDTAKLLVQSPRALQSSQNPLQDSNQL